MTTFVAVPLIAVVCTTVIWLGSIAWAAWHESHTPDDPFDEDYHDRNRIRAELNDAGQWPGPICPQDGLPCDTTYPCVACGCTPPTQQEER